MVWLVGALLLCWLAWGPLVPVAAAAALCVPRIRWWVQDRAHVERRTSAWVAGVLVVLTGVVVVVPDGWLPVPPGPGLWAAPAYVGRPATPRPIAADAARNPHLPVVGPADRPGPLGLQPEVESAWLGLQRCGRIEVTSQDLLVAMCAGRSGPSLRLVDADTLRPLDTEVLPEAPDGSACAGEAFFLGARDRVVVATTDRRVVVLHASGSDGDADLVEETSWDLRPYVPHGDCLTALAPDWAGRVWWTSGQGLVGTIAPDSGQVRVIDLGEDVDADVVADDAGVFVVTDAALHRLAAGPDGTPQVVWRTAYDGAGASAPVLVEGGAVAIAVDADTRADVVFLERGSGRVVCRHPVFEEGESAVGGPLAPLGSGVVVTNGHDHSSPRSTLLGFTSTPGVARVDLVDGACVERWSTDLVSAPSGSAPSLPNGLLYTSGKRASKAGVSAWYVTALDARTGRGMWSVRTGTGLLSATDRSRVTVGPDGSVVVGTPTGLVRVRDRRQGQASPTVSSLVSHSRR